MSTEPHNLVGDLLLGGAAIADYVNEFIGAGAKIDRKEAYRLIDAGVLPAGHLGAKVIGSKAEIASALRAAAKGGRK